MDGQTKEKLYIITEHESLHQKKQFDWMLRGHDPFKNSTFTFNKRSFFDVKVTLPGNRCLTNDYVVKWYRLT